MELNWNFITQLFFACCISVIFTAGIKKQITVIINKHKDAKYELNRFIGLGLVYISSYAAGVYFYILEDIKSIPFFIITGFLLTSLTVVLYEAILKNLLELPGVALKALIKKLGDE